MAFADYIRSITEAKVSLEDTWDDVDCLPPKKSGHNLYYGAAHNVTLGSLRGKEICQVISCIQNMDIPRHNILMPSMYE